MPQPIPIYSYEQAIQLIHHRLDQPRRVRVTLATIKAMINDPELQAQGGSVAKVDRMEADPSDYVFPIEFYFNSIGLTIFEVDLHTERNNGSH